EIGATFAQVGDDVVALEDVLAPTTAGRHLRDLPLGELATKFDRLASDSATLETIPQRVQSLRNLSDWGLDDLVADLTARRVSTDIVGAEFDLAWWSSVLEEMLTVDPAMVALDPGVLEEGLAKLQSADRTHVESLLAP